EDVFMASACSLTLPNAVSAFERDYLQPALPGLRRFRTSDDFVQEAAQAFRAKLFSGEAPRIANYSGSGPLQAWVRIGLTRTGIDLLRQANHFSDIEPD